MSRLKRIFKQLLDDQEQITFFATYGYQQKDEWVIPLRAWVHEPRKVVETVGTLLLNVLRPSTEKERRNFKVRLGTIIADSESWERVVFSFDKDPQNEMWQIQSKDGSFPKSDLNGVIEGHIRISTKRVQEIKKAQEPAFNWLRIHAVSDDHCGVGCIQLIEPKGLSIISDIDDTLKITEIPAGGKTVVRNTFLRDFVPVEGLIKKYTSFDSAAFHYVSGAPWQLYTVLFEFIVASGLPMGSFHMKDAPTNLLSPHTWSDLLKLIGDATIEQKMHQISKILETFPNRRFILVGDSGEHDPEIYRKLRKKYGTQIDEIIIRDVVNTRKHDPERLAGMTIIPAQTIREGVSQFDAEVE